ncbi:hypothetical protein GCM10023114_43800 [Mycolicibacterium sediminis]|uniref:Uncharacterized protein n=1 Tax=Mycolicibacterium sediminis TaxID=1286180 RepID=A0A7I7QVS1_9MYCO|nr:hypothetical protein MSEDJ_41120 [Mycolicibacterium sediminis]
MNDGVEDDVLKSFGSGGRDQSLGHWELVDELGRGRVIDPTHPAERGLEVTRSSEVSDRDLGGAVGSGSLGLFLVLDECTDVEIVAREFSDQRTSNTACGAGD